MRLLPRLPRHLPDGRISRALPARCAALHLLPHHREQGADPARVPRGDRQPHLWLRRLPRRLPLEQVRQAAHPRRSSPRATICASRALAELLALDDAAFRSALFGLAGQTHRPRPLPAQRAHRRRQFGRRVAGRRCRALARRCLAPGARRGRVGAVAAAAARRFGEACARSRRGSRMPMRPSGMASPTGAPSDMRTSSRMTSHFFIFGAGYSAKTFAAARPRASDRDRRAPHVRRKNLMRCAAPVSSRCRSTDETFSPELLRHLGRRRT